MSSMPSIAWAHKILRLLRARGSANHLTYPYEVEALSIIMYKFCADAAVKLVAAMSRELSARQFPQFLPSPS